jgi:hypothetical protein
MTDPAPSSDPLLRHVPLPHTADVPVLGVPVRFRSNSGAVLAAVHGSFGRWTRPERNAESREHPSLEVRIVLHPGTEPQTRRTPVAVRMPDADRLLWHTPGSVGMVDLGRGTAVAYVTQALVDDVEHFGYTVLEGMTLTLVATRDRLPVHASLIERNGRAVVLTGPSGRGKSTLAYAALRRGWRVLADDGVYVQTSPSLAVWGRPAPLLLPGDARDRYRELAGREPTRQAGGKLKIPVDTGLATQPEPLRQVAVCVLARGGAPSLAPLKADELLAALTRELEPGLELYGDAPLEVARRLSAGGGWRLTLSDDPNEAIDLLGRLAG